MNNTLAKRRPVDLSYVSMEKTTRIVVVPSPGFSHLVPILEFSKRLVQLHPDFHVTCNIPTLGSPSTTSKAYLETLPSNIDSIFLPPVSKDDLPQVANPGVQIQFAVALSLPYIRKELESISSRNTLVALVADIFAIEALDFAAEFNIFSYIYLPQAAMVFSLYFYSLKLDETVYSEFRDLQEPVEIPGCVPVQGRDLPDPFQDRCCLAYKQFLERSRRVRLADGVLVNSFLEMETETIRALQEEIRGKKPQIYPVGPITQSGSSTEPNGSDCLRWLNYQPPRSVLYVSFGSGGTLSQEQLNELASGLELIAKDSYGLRAPSNIASAAYLGATNEDPLHFLPKGFMEKTKEQGLVIPSWAPQIPILSHSSVGGFLSHCGWNSIIESVLQGVPLITWPLFAEQRMNYVLLTVGLKVAQRPKLSENGIVERKEIAKVVRILMEGEKAVEIRKRMKGLKDAAATALKENGSSWKTLSLFAFNLRAK